MAYFEINLIYSCNLKVSKLSHINKSKYNIDTSPESKLILG